MTTRIVSALNRPIDDRRGRSQNTVLDAIQTDAARSTVTPGALVNMNAPVRASSAIAAGRAEQLV